MREKIRMETAAMLDFMTIGKVHVRRNFQTACSNTVEICIHIDYTTLYTKKRTRVVFGLLNYKFVFIICMKNTHKCWQYSRFIERKYSCAVLRNIFVFVAAR